MRIPNIRPKIVWCVCVCVWIEWFKFSKMICSFLQTHATKLLNSSPPPNLKPLGNAMIFIIDLILCENYYYFRVSVSGCDVRIWFFFQRLKFFTWTARGNEKKNQEVKRPIHSYETSFMDFIRRRKEKTNVHLIMCIWLCEWAHCAVAFDCFGRSAFTWNRVQSVHVAILKWQMICFYAGLWTHSLQCPALLKMERPKFNCGLVPCDK